MKISELRKFSANDLQKKLAELRQQIQELKFSIANNQLSKIRQLRQAKKEVAKILTIINASRKKEE